MKRGGYILFFAAVIGIAAFAITNRLRCRLCPDDNAWLRQEFHLTENQITAIEKLRDEYRPICAEHCAKISQTHQALDRLNAAGQSNSADYKRTKAEWEKLCQECTRATRHHMEQIAAIMPPEQGRRYLELVTPKLTQQDHTAPLGLK